MTEWGGIEWRVILEQNVSFWGKMFTEGGMFGVNGRLMRSGDSRSIPDQTEKRFETSPTSTQVVNPRNHESLLGVVFEKYVGSSDWWRSQVSAIPPFRKWPDPIDGTFARTFWPPSSKLNWKRPFKRYFCEYKLSKERFGILGGYLSLKGALWIFDFFLLQRQLLPFFPSSKVKHYHRM